MYWEFTSYTKSVRMPMHIPHHVFICQNQFLIFIGLTNLAWFKVNKCFFFNKLDLNQREIFQQFSAVEPRRIYKRYCLVYLFSFWQTVESLTLMEWGEADSAHTFFKGLFLPKINGLKGSNFFTYIIYLKRFFSEFLSSINPKLINLCVKFLIMN